MKIVQVIQKPQLRGAEMFACLLSNELLELGHDVTLICLFRGKDKLPFKGKTIFLNLSIRNRFWDMLGWRKLALSIRQSSASIVQANAADTLKFTVISKLLFTWAVPIVYRNASMVSQYIKGSLSKAFNRFLFSKIDFVISVSHATCHDLASIFPFLSTKLQIIPIAIKIPESIPKERNIQAPVFIHIGGFTFEKNHKQLILIFKAIKSKYSGATLILVGDGLLRIKVEDMVNNLGLSASVVFLGNRHDVNNLLTQADIFILPSIIEGLPSVILEAFATQVPVIASKVGGIPEIVQDHKTGWLVNGHSEKDFLISTEEILQNTASTNQVVKNAFELAKNQYNIQNVSQQFVDVYKKLETQ